MTEKVRINLHLSQETEKSLNDLAKSASTTRTEIIRQSLALMKLAQTAKQEGRHLGFVKERDKLDTEIVGLLW